MGCVIVVPDASGADFQAGGGEARSVTWTWDVEGTARQLGSASRCRVEAAMPAAYIPGHANPPVGGGRAGRRGGLGRARPRPRRDGQRRVAHRRRRRHLPASPTASTAASSPTGSPASTTAAPPPPSGWPTAATSCPPRKWVLFGHHFAAIAGAGPLVGPVLAAQFGYLPGTLWIVFGVVLAGAVQDFIILFASMRRDGKSLGQMAGGDRPGHRASSPWSPSWPSW